MPRANRYHIPGCIWHITHRCHKREFLLKFARDRRRWVRWLFEARKRYGLTVLNHMVTSNHIHLLVVDGDDESTIARSMQLVAGRTAQDYNLRKICVRGVRARSGKIAIMPRPLSQGSICVAAWPTST